MTSHPDPDEAIAGLLDEIAGQLGHPVPAHLQAALRAVSRHLFLPPTLWLRDGNGGHEPCDRESEPDRWWRAAYRDAPLVTQFTKGGQQPHVVCADGAGGWPPNAPYDRIIATCSVRTVPLPWLEQTVTGGLLVIPWDTPWCNFGTLIATKQADGTAEGVLAPYGAFMLMRAQRVEVELHRDVLREGQKPDRSVTELSPWSVAGTDLAAQLHIGLRVPGTWHAWDTEGEAAHTRLWLADDEATSWASVDYDGRQLSAFAVAQYGPRRLWDEVARAYEGYVAAGRPGVPRHRLRISPDGAGTRHQVTLS
ncbi:methyltransferase [Streptomyces sp. NPDC127097]|uniref:methyltransferase n=1 Tax=Streptomyces sp. NPDC127097 TaxID=3347136 RepID=UPI003660B035